MMNGRFALAALLVMFCRVSRAADDDPGRGFFDGARPAPAPVLELKAPSRRSWSLGLNEALSTLGSKAFWYTNYEAELPLGRFGTRVHLGFDRGELDTGLATPYTQQPDVKSVKGVFVAIPYAGLRQEAPGVEIKRTVTIAPFAALSGAYVATRVDGTSGVKNTAPNSLAAVLELGLRAAFRDRLGLDLAYERIFHAIPDLSIERLKLGVFIVPEKLLKFD